jgi:hypothetical protein
MMSLSQPVFLPPPQIALSPFIMLMPELSLLLTLYNAAIALFIYHQNHNLSMAALQWVHV